MKSLQLVLIGCVVALYVTGSLAVTPPSSTLSTTTVPKTTTPAVTQPTTTLAGQGTTTVQGSGDTTTPSGAGAMTVSLVLPAMTSVLCAVMGVLGRQ